MTELQTLMQSNDPQFRSSAKPVCAYTGNNINSLMENGETLLQLAVREGRLNMVLNLILHHADTRTITMLEDADARHNQHVIYQLVRVSQSLNSMSIHADLKEHLFCEAFKQKYTDLVHYLLAQGIRFDVMINGNNIVHILCMHACVDMVPQETYLRLKMLNERNMDGKTPLILAVESQSAIGVKTLLNLDKRVDVDLPDRHGKTPLMYAVEQGNAAVVELLMCCEASIDKADDMKNTVFMMAAQSGNMDVFETLTADINPSGYINTLNTQSETALTIAAQRGHVDCVYFLLPHAMSFNKKAR